jgi:hypothetical protein
MQVADGRVGDASNVSVYGAVSCIAFLRSIVNLARMSLVFVRTLGVSMLALLPGLAAEPLRWETGSGHRSAAVSPAQPGRTGFTLLPASQTGIQFTNTLSMEAAAKNHNLMQSAGVAAGDFDGDGLCDLYFCTVEGRNTLYRNLGDFRFTDVTEAAGVATTNLFSTGAIFADVNGDGRLDLLVSANNGGPTFFLNQGDGRFTNATAASGISMRPLGGTSLALGDLDGNGTLDLFVANYGETTILRSGGNLSVRTVNGQPVVSGRDARRWKIINGRIIEFGEPSAVYLNDGQGKFTPLSWTGGAFLDEDGQPLKQQPMDLSLSVLLRDINGDGAPDIYVCNDFQTPDRIWINDGRARFRAAHRRALRQTSVFSMGVDFADLDRDGRDDFIVVDMLSRLHSLRMTQMTETNMTPPRPGDIDNRPQIRRNTVFWNRGDGTYAEIANFAGLEASDWSWTPAFLDVDLDGYEDLLVSNGHARDTQDLDATRNPMDKSAAGALQHLAQFPKLETPNYAFRNRGDLTFEETGESWGFNSKQVCHGIVFADIDNDGDLDSVLSSLNDAPLIYRNESPAPRVTVRLKGQAPNTRGIGAKIVVRGGAVPEQSQQMVSGGRYLSADEAVRAFAAGTLTNRMTIEVTWRNGRRSLLKDVVPNRIYEIDETEAQISNQKTFFSNSPPLFVDASSLLGHRHHEEAFDDFARQPLLSKKLSQLGPGVAWMDLNGDGHDDLVIGSGRGGAPSVFHSTGKGMFNRTNLAGLATDDLLGLSSWVSEGKKSLLVARASYEASETAAVLSLTSSAIGVTVQTQKLISQGSPGPIATADVDGNGTLEMFIGGRVIAGRYPESGYSIVPSLEATRELGLVSGAVWSDLEGDGFPELILACEWGPLKIFRNSGGKLTPWNPRVASPALNAQLSTLGSFTGWWSSVTTGDFDGDGRLDIVAGNWGLNSGCRASPSSPLRLYHGDLAGDGSVQIVESEFDATLKKFFPQENLTMLAPSMPFLRARFPTHASFRNVGVSDAFADRIRVAKELEVTTLASMLFLNRGDHFEARPLPREAQWAPIFGISVADADGDGAEDVFLAQNFFATRDDVPRLDAGRGLWLRNDGKGNLVPMRAEDSGVYVWGEQRGCAVSDFDQDGRIDLVVAQNAGETKLFRNQRARPGLRIRLQGPAGNPDGLGAVVRLKHDSGFGPAHEVHGGSGYLSQDSAMSVLGMVAPPTQVVVRWPGGKNTETPVPAGAKEVIVTY